jgi:ABC-2 type transport system permease protein
MSDTRPAGSIYDLGYRSYDGERLGRPHAIWALYLHTLRGVFGIGRSWWAKIASFGLAFIAFLPAIVVLAVTSIFSGEIDIFEHEDYYGVIAIVLALFCAVVAPETVGRDQQTKTLSLYFSRALRRQDYALAKFIALLTAMLTITLLPQLLMFVGNGLAVDDFGEYFRDNWDDIPAIAASAVILSAFFAGIGLIIAAQTPRRAFSTIGILAVFLVMLGVAEGIVDADPDVGKFILYISPMHVLEGFTIWLFDAAPDTDSALEKADLPEITFVLEAIALSFIFLGLLIQRYERISA